jgi:hypothetical protein
MVFIVRHFIDARGWHFVAWFELCQFKLLEVAVISARKLDINGSLIDMPYLWGLTSCGAFFSPLEELGAVPGLPSAGPFYFRSSFVTGWSLLEAERNQKRRY